MGCHVLLLSHSVYTWCVSVTGEQLEKGIQPAYVLADSEALVLQASEAFTHTNNQGRSLPANQQLCVH